MKKKEKAVVVFSGGQDSTTCLFWALERFEEVEAVTFDYNQRHSLEIECAQNIAKELGVNHHILDMSLLNQLAPNALTRSDIAVADGEEGELPSTFVPGGICCSFRLPECWRVRLALNILSPVFVKRISADILTAAMYSLNR